MLTHHAPGRTDDALDALARSCVQHDPLSVEVTGKATCWRPLVTITDIWVDSAASLHGGRQLWGIPKQRASLQVDGATCAAVGADGELIASSAVRPIGALPGLCRSRYAVTCAALSPPP